MLAMGVDRSEATYQGVSHVVSLQNFNPNPFTAMAEAMYSRGHAGWSPHWPYEMSLKGFGASQVNNLEAV